MFPNEALGYHLSDMWPVFDAQLERERDQWEHTRQISYYVARFGNSDPKGFPASLHAFMPFDWDEGANTDSVMDTYRRNKALLKQQQNAR